MPPKIPPSYCLKCKDKTANTRAGIEKVQTDSGRWMNKSVCKVCKGNKSQMTSAPVAAAAKKAPAKAVAATKKAPVKAAAKKKKVVESEDEDDE